MAGGSAGHCRGIRLREDHAAEVDLRAPDAAAGGNSLREPFAVCNERGRPPSPAAYRMGRGASASTRRPAPSGLGRRQYRRAADGDRGTSLRRYSCHRAEVAGRGGNSRQPDRRPADHLFRRHAATFADRPQPGDASEAGVYGRADRRTGCVGTGTPARPAARPGGGAEPRGSDCHPRFRRRPPAGGPFAGDEAGASGGEWVNRPRARRPASSVYTAAGVIGFAELSRCRMRRKRLIRPTNALPVGRIRRVSVASDTRTTRRKMLNVQTVSKTFILHQQHGVRLPVLNRASLIVNAGECVVLHGHSGSGKSTLLRSLYANYLPDEGQIQIKHGDEWVDLVTAPARKVVEI